MGHIVTIVVLGIVARMEPRFINKRQRDGLERAKAKSIIIGGKRRFDRTAISALAAEGISPIVIARQVGCSKDAGLSCLARVLTGCFSQLLRNKLHVITSPVHAIRADPDHIG